MKQQVSAINTAALRSARMIAAFRSCQFLPTIVLFSSVCAALTPSPAIADQLVDPAQIEGSSSHNLPIKTAPGLQISPELLAALGQQPQGVGASVPRATAGTRDVPDSKSGINPRMDSGKGDVKGFWQQQVARDWEARPRENSSQDVVFEPTPKRPVADNVAKAPNAQPPAPNQPAPQEKLGDQRDPRTREEVLAKYGSPETFTPVRAKQDAPAEFRGLMDALNIGDKELAFQYARAYARRTYKMQELLSKATEYQVVAAEAEGFRGEFKQEDSAAAISPERRDLEPYLKQAKEERLRKAISNELADEIGGMDPEKAQQVIREHEELAKVARKADPQIPIPVDPQGKVRLLFFINETSPKESTEFLARMNELKTTFGKDRDISFVALTEHTYLPQGLKKISTEFGDHFALVNGEALLKQLKITQFPTVVFVAQTTKQTYRLGGDTGNDAIEKVIRLMKGGR